MNDELKKAYLKFQEMTMVYKRTNTGLDGIARVRTALAEKDAAEAELSRIYTEVVPEREQECIDAGMAAACCCTNGVHEAEAYCRFFLGKEIPK